MYVPAHTPCGSPRSGARGFTLIELLVVIGIIALLIGILLPVLAMARKTSEQVTCAANVKQIGVALELFANDHRDDYPMAGRHIEWGTIDPKPGGTGLPSWMEQIDYYVNAEKPVFDGCPNYPETTPYHYFLGTRAAYVKHHGFASVSRKLIRYTTAFVLGGDSNWNGFIEGEDGGQFDNDADKDDYTQPCAVLGITEDTATNWVPHHEGGLNILFADNHVSYMREFDPNRMTYRYAEMSDW